MITIVAHDGTAGVKVVADEWMPPNMAIMIVGDDVVVYKSGKVSLITLDELRDIADEAYKRFAIFGVHDARQPV